MKQLLHIGFCILTANALGQVTMSNFNVDVVSSGNVFINVDGHVVNEAGGEWDNSGTIDLTGDWTNIGGNTAFVNNSPGLVTLTGANQAIGGTDVTRFHNLSLQGTGTKTLGIDARVTDSLALNDRELDAVSFSITVMNSATDAVTRTGTMTPPFDNATNEGMVSSLLFNNAALNRAVSAGQTYVYPVGASAAVARFRPVQMTAVSNDTIGVSLINTDPTIDGFDVLQFDNSLCRVFDSYYHYIEGNSNADLTIYNDDAADGDWQRIAYWSTATTEWNNSLSNKTNNASPTLSEHTLGVWSLGVQTNNWFTLASEAPVVGIEFSDSVICIGESVDVSVTPTGLPYSYTWTPGPTAESFTDSPIANTMYVVTADNGFCTYTDSLPLTVVTPAVVDLGPDLSVQAGDCVTLSVSNPGTYVWSPVTGLSCTTCSSPDACPTVTTTYTVTVTDSNGCVVSDDITVDVTEDYSLWVPNVFSPNGDGQNDVLYAYGNGITSIRFAIHDRWGELIFESTDLTSGWDGTYKGEALNAQVLVYYAEAVFQNGDVENIHGNVTLVR